MGLRCSSADGVNRDNHRSRQRDAPEPWTSVHLSSRGCGNHPPCKRHPVATTYDARSQGALKIVRPESLFKTGPLPPGSCCTHSFVVSFFDLTIPETSSPRMRCRPQPPPGGASVHDEPEHVQDELRRHNRFDPRVRPFLLHLDGDVHARGPEQSAAKAARAWTPAGSA